MFPIFETYAKIKKNFIFKLLKGCITVFYATFYNNSYLCENNPDNFGKNCFRSILKYSTFFFQILKRIAVITLQSLFRKCCCFKINKRIIIVFLVDYVTFI